MEFTLISARVTRQGLYFGRICTETGSILTLLGHHYRMDDVIEAVCEFLRREGGIGVLVKIDEENGNTFSDLAGQVHVTRNTLSNRLEEATDLDVLRETTHPSDHGNAVRYALTTRGERVRYLLDVFEMGQLYADFLRTRQKMEDGVEFVEDVYDPKPYDPGFEEYLRKKKDDEPK